MVLRHALRRLGETLYQAGFEGTVNRHLRFELNLSQQTDTLPETSRLNAFSVVLKGYY